MLARDEMAVDANNFDQSVRIFVDTDVDTHFIVSILRTSTVAELRELVKVTHRHCYPGNGDVDIGKLAVPGGEYGYHLADFLRIGQVYDKFEGKVLAEVKSPDPGSSNRDDLFRMPSLSFTNSLKKVPLLAPHPFETVSEPGALLAVEPREELKEPELQKEEFDGDEDCLLGSQKHLDRLPWKGSGLAVRRLQESVEEEDEKVVERAGTALCDGGAETSAADLVTKVSGLKPDTCVADVHMDLDKISEGAKPELTFDIKGVSRKRDASVSNERPSKSRRLTAPAPSDSTSDVPEENGLLEVRNEAIERAEVDGMHNIVKDVNEPTGASVSHMDRSGDLDSNLKSSSGSKRKKKKLVRNLDLTISENRIEAVKGVRLEVEDKEEMCDAMNGEKEDTGVAIGSGAGGSGIVGLEVGREEKLGSLPEGSGVSPSPRPKKKKKKREQKQELNQEQEQEQERKPKKAERKPRKEKKNLEQELERKPKNEKKKKQKKCEINPVVSASLNHVSDREHEQENGRCTEADVTPALVDPGHQLGATATSPNHSQHVNNNKEEVDNNDVIKDVEKKKKGRKLMKKGSAVAAAVAVDASNQKGSQDAGRSPVLNLLKDEASENQTPRREAGVLRETSGEGTIQNGAELARIDDKALSPKLNLFSNFNDVETSTSPKGGTGASPYTQVAKVGFVESQETPNPSKRAGRGAPSETRNSGSSEGVTKAKGIDEMDTKASELQSSQGSEKATQHSEGINKGSEVSAAQMHRCRVNRSTNYSEANSEHANVSPGKVAHVSSERFERELGHIDQSKVAKPDKVSHSRSCTGESSAESDPRSADHTEVRSQQDGRRKEDLSPTLGSVRSPEKHASTSPKRAEGGDIIIKNDSLQFYSQDQSFQVAPTQVAKALSGNITEDSSDESDTNPDEDIDELKKKKADNFGISDKGVGESQESSDESEDLATTGCRDNPPLTTRTPLPLVSGITGSGGIKSSQIFKRRASGVTAEIEAKFAHFIESQDGLDELMGITLGQRKRSMPLEPSTQAGSLATAPDSPLDLALNTQESVKTPSSVVGLERYQAVDLAPASQNSTGKLPAPHFKVPKPVPIGKVSGAAQGVLSSAAAATAVQPSGKEVPKAALKQLRLKRKDSVDKKKESNSLLEKQNDASHLPIRVASKETSMNDEDAAGILHLLSTPKSAGIYNLLSTPETLKETFRDDLNAAVDRKTSVEKNSEERKRLEDSQFQDSQFMIVNNTDHIPENETEDKKLESDEDAPNKTGNKRKERQVRREDVETGVVGSQETSGFDTGGKKKKRKKRKVDGEGNVLPETSVDRSARETEELYLKLEKANRDLWLQKEDEKIVTRDSPEAVESEDVAQSRLEGGESQIQDTENNKVKVMSDTPVPGGNAAGSHESRDLCAGTTEASDREDGGFLSQDEKAGASHQEKYQKDVYDFVSEDETPMNTVSKSAKKSGIKEDEAKRLEDVASRAVQRVLEDEMLHIMDSNSGLGKKSRKDAKPVKWTVRMRAGSPSALATSVHGGTIPSDAINPTQFISSPYSTSEPAGNVSGRGAQVKRGLEGSAKPPRATKARAPPKPKQSGAEMCPVGCGRMYTSRTSAYYSHKRKCTGAPAE